MFALRDEIWGTARQWPWRWLTGGVLCGALACGADDPLPESAFQDNTPPLLTLLSPDRGTRSNSSVVYVVGEVIDESTVSVTINGAAAALAQGTFEAAIHLEPGVTLLTVVAQDEFGNRTQETRSVLSGEFRPVGQPAENGMVVRLNQATLDVAQAIGLHELYELDLIEYIDNPVIDEGGFCGTQVSIKSYQYGEIVSQLTPTNGGIAFEIVFKDVAIKGTGKKCVSTDFTLSMAEARVQGMFVVGLTGGSQPGFTLTVEDLHTELIDVDASGGFLVDFVDLFVDFEEKIKNGIETALTETAPPHLETFLNSIFEQFHFTVGGQTFELTLQPSQVHFDSSGGLFVADVVVATDSANEVQCLHSTSSVPAEVQASSGMVVQMAISNEVLNQALCAVWASGVFNRTLYELPTGGESLFASLIDRVEMSLTMPPILAPNNSNGWTATVGDVLIEVVGKGSSQTIAQIAMTMKSEFNAVVGEDGRIQSLVEDSAITFDVLPGATLSAGANQLEVLSNGLSGAVNGLVGGFLNGYKIPTFHGLGIVNSQINSPNGYMLFTGDLAISL